MLGRARLPLGRWASAWLGSAVQLRWAAVCEIRNLNFDKYAGFWNIVLKFLVLVIIVSIKNGFWNIVLDFCIIVLNFLVIVIN